MNEYRNGITWEQFAALWAANFPAIKDEDGIQEWKRFIERVTSPSLIREVVEELARKSAEVKKANPAATVSKPRLMDVRLLFNEKAAERAARYRQEQAAKCSLCGGDQNVTIAISKDPERRILKPSETTWSEFGGFEAIPCPKCCRAYYYGRESLAEIIEQRCARSTAELYDRINK